MDLTINSIEHEKCTGCKMCGDLCPETAISFQTDNEGFWYPVVAENKCVGCGLCAKRCPSLNPYVPTENKMPEVYAVWSKDEEVRISSTSGGAFWVIAKKFMDAGGLVAGSRYGEDWKSAEHILAHNLDELLQVKGSKYFQSDTKRIYSEVKTALCEGKKVLFCGTPCQNAAIRNYLGKEYENLFCMDFICRSINSPKAFKAYIEELEVEYSSKVCEVHLKNKKGGWQSLASQVCFENGRESIRDRNEDWWVKGFIYNDLYTRESCYHCQYREFPRKSSDITIGDFWGIKNQSDRDMFKGISVVMINSAKGKVLFDNAKDDMVVQRHTLDEVIEGNSALLENPVRTVKQDQFFKLLQRNPFSICVKKCTKENVIKFMKRKIFRMVKSAITKTSHIWNILKDKKISVFSYIYYNYFCKNIIRCGGAKIIPCKGTVLELHPTARIYLKGRNLEICGNKLNKSKSETHIRMRKNSVWNCNNGGYLFYDTVLEVDENAVLDTGYFSANGGSVIMAHKHITLGEDVMMGRNIIVYDSDFHTLNNRYGVPSNPPKPVVIEDHVWLTTNVMVQKGVTIGKDSLIAAYTVVNKDIPEHSIVGGKSVGIVIGDEISWSRDTCPME